jgi:hypothetical protein
MFSTWAGGLSAIMNPGWQLSSEKGGWSQKASPCFRFETGKPQRRQLSAVCPRSETADRGLGHMKAPLLRRTKTLVGPGGSTLLRRFDTGALLRSKFFLRFLFRKTWPDFCLWRSALDAIMAVRASVFWMVQRTGRHSDQLVTVVLEVKRSAAFRAEAAGRDWRRPKLGGLLVRRSQLVSRA